MLRYSIYSIPKSMGTVTLGELGVLAIAIAAVLRQKRDELETRITCIVIR